MEGRLANRACGDASGRWSVDWYTGVRRQESRRSRWATRKSPLLFGGKKAAGPGGRQESRPSCHLASYQDRPVAMSTFSGTCREATPSMFSRISSRTSSISASSASTTSSS